MKYYQILILLTLVYYVSGYITFHEGEDIRYMGSRVLDIALHMLRDNFPYIGSSSFVINDPKMLEIKSKEKPDAKFFRDNNTVQIIVPKNAFTFKLDFLWTFTWKNIIPLTGVGHAKVIVNDYVLMVNYKNSKVDGTIEKITWKVENLTITGNRIADKLKLQPIIKRALQDQFEQVVTNHLKTKVFPKAKVHLERAYPPTRDYVFPFPDRKLVVEFHYKIKEIKVQEDYVETIYEKVDGSIGEVEEPRISYGLGIHFPVEMIKLPLQTLFVQALKDITVSQKDLPSGSLFQLTSRQFAQVIPDIHMEKGNFDMEVKIESTNTNPSIILENTNTVIVKNLEFKLKFAELGKPLLDTTINMTAYFELSLVIGRGDTCGYANLKVNTADVNIKEVTTYDYQTYYKAGLKKYIMSGIENWIKPYWSNKVIANGIYVEYDGVLSITESSAMFNEDNSMINVKLIKY